MNDKESFKIGFLMKCAEEGLTPAQVESRIMNSASLIKKADPISGAFGEIVGGLKAVLGAAWPLALAAPAAAGGFGGYALSKAQDDSYDVEEAKKREELAEYYRAIDQLQRSTRRKNIEFS